MVWTVDDRRNVSEVPKRSLSMIDFDFYDRSMERPLTRPLELERAHRAQGVNALDEVPDSTWFTNRIGKATLTPDQIRRGPVVNDGPDEAGPWTIHSTKFGGASLGLIITDARGVKYMIKFETPGFPEVESGADVVGNRLVWAAGYNVPHDTVVTFRTSMLVLAPDAMVRDQLGNSTHRLDQEELSKELAKLTRTPDGRIRAVASRWLEGTSLGGSPTEGVRKDDPNDRIPHERRRDLRGQLPIFQWLNYVDLPRSNMLDMLVTDPADPRKRYVVHYRVDFDSTLGSIGTVLHDPRQGFANSFDWGELATEVGTIGAKPRPWRRYAAPPFRGVASTFTAVNFDPGAWKPNIPYAPFDMADRFDGFWGAKIVARFTREQIRAAVEAAQYSDPRATDYITDTLVARQHEVVKYWFDRVNPLDHFVAGPSGLCFDDLAISAGLAAPGATEYVLTSRDRTGHPIARNAYAAGPTGSTCATAVPVAGGQDGYTIIEIATIRPGFRKSTFVYLARDPGSSRLRVIGVWRT